MKNIAEVLFKPGAYVEITGTYASKLFPVDCGIERCHIDTSCNSDIEAIHKIQSFATALGITDIKTEYNPDFYPTMKLPEPSEELLEKQQLVKNIIEQNIDELPPGAMMIHVTHEFDVFGDFVMARFIKSGIYGTFTSKILVDPDDYLKAKHSIYVSNNLFNGDTQGTPGVTVH